MQRVAPHDDADFSRVSESSVAQALLAFRLMPVQPVGATRMTRRAVFMR
jgi:hypothetical protein